jgi:hypothetical protein
MNVKAVKGPCAHVGIYPEEARHGEHACAVRSTIPVLVREIRLSTPASCCRCAFKPSSSRWPLCPFAMSSLTVEPTSAHIPSQLLSDQNVQNMGISDTPDRRGQATASYERKLGDTEVSYYLQGRATGVNDMFVLLARGGFSQSVYPAERQVPSSGIQVSQALCASAQSARCMGHFKDATSAFGIERGDARLRRYQICVCLPYQGQESCRTPLILWSSFHPPASPEAALAEAESQLDYQQKGKDGKCGDRDLGVLPLSSPVDLIDSYLNGPRTLSNERLSYLIVSQTPTLDGPLPTPSASAAPPDQLADADGVLNYELLICAAHFIGDGMALHQFANDFFGLLGGASSQEELDQLVSNEWKQRWGETLISDVRP